MESYYPPAGFYFNLLLAKEKLLVCQEVSGLEVTSTSEEERDLENGFSRVPRIVKHTNLVLKRGIADNAAAFMEWCSPISEDLNTPITPNSLTLQLLNEKGSPIMEWHFHQAYPVKYYITSSDVILVEAVEIAYSSYEMITVATL